MYDFSLRTCSLRLLQARDQLPPSLPPATPDLETGAKRYMPFVFLWKWKSKTGAKLCHTSFHCCCCISYSLSCHTSPKILFPLNCPLESARPSWSLGIIFSEGEKLTIWVACFPSRLYGTYCPTANSPHICLCLPVAPFLLLLCPPLRDHFLNSKLSLRPGPSSWAALKTGLRSPRVPAKWSRSPANALWNPSQ